MSDGTRPRPASWSFFYAWWLVLQALALGAGSQMLQPLAMGRPSANQGRTRGDAIRGVMIGAPIAAVLWIPIVWVATHLL